jgi:hypothetical protein
VTQASDAAAAAQLAAASASATANGAIGSSVVGIPLGNPAGWVFSRASIRSGFDVLGNVEDVQAQQAQAGFSRTTGAPLGVLVNRQRTNLIRNSRGLGFSAATGITGAVNAANIPTNWRWATRTAGVTLDVSPCTFKGMSGYRIRYYGSITGTGAETIGFDARNVLPVPPSGPISSRFFGRLVAGSIPAGATPQHRLIQTLATAATLDSLSTITLDGTLREYERRIVAASNAAFAAPEFRIAWASNTVMDLTVELYFPGMQTRPFIGALTLPASGVVASATVEQDQITVPAGVLGTQLSQTQGTFVATLSTVGAFTSTDPLDWLGVASFGDGTTNNMLGLAINPAHTSVEARLTTNGVANASAAVAMTAPAAETTFKVAIAWNAAQIQAAARGAASAKIPVTVGLPAILQAMIGRLATTNGMSGAFTNLDLRPGAVFDSALSALT